jgi:YD repeat-containing protein
LARATNAAGEFHFERDAIGRIIREVQRVHGEEQWVELAYDKAGNRIGRKTLLGHVETVERDAMGARWEWLSS